MNELIMFLDRQTKETDDIIFTSKEIKILFGIRVPIGEDIIDSINDIYWDAKIDNETNLIHFIRIE